MRKSNGLKTKDITKAPAAAPDKSASQVLSQLNEVSTLNVGYPVIAPSTDFPYFNEPENTIAKQEQFMTNSLEIIPTPKENPTTAQSNQTRKVNQVPLIIQEDFNPNETKPV